MVGAHVIIAKTGRVQDQPRIFEPASPHRVASFDVAGHVLLEFLHGHGAATGRRVKREAKAAPRQGGGTNREKNKAGLGSWKEARMKVNTKRFIGCSYATRLPTPDPL